MTSPDQQSPAGALNAGNVAQIQYVTQSSAALAQSADLRSTLEDVEISFLDIILGGFGNVIEAIMAHINQFISDLLKSISGAIGNFFGLSNWLKGTKEIAQNAQEQVINTGQVIQQVRTDVAVISAPMAESWETMVPGQQVSFPRALLNSSWKDSYDSTNNSNPGGRYDQVITISDSNTYIRYSKQPKYYPALNSVESVWILSNYAVGRAMVTFSVEAVSGSPAGFYVYISRMLPNGDCKIEWVSANQTPLMSNARAERSVVLPDATEIGFASGEYMCVSFHQPGAGVARPLLGLEMTPIPRTGETFPPQQKWSVNSSSVLSPGTTIAMADQNYTSNYVPWVGIGQRLFTGDPLPRHYFDDFQRAEMGPGWVSTADKPLYIYNGETSYVRSAFPADGIARYTYAQPLAYDDQRVIGTAAGNGVGNLTSEPMKLLYRCSASGTTYCSLDVRDSSVTIAAMINNRPLALKTYNNANQVNDKFKVEVVGNVHTAYRKRGSDDWIALTQHDDGGSLNRGASYRYTGVSSQRNSFTSSGGWKDFECEDLVEVTP